MSNFSKFRVGYRITYEDKEMTRWESLWLFWKDPILVGVLCGLFAMNLVTAYNVGQLETNVRINNKAISVIVDVIE